VLECIDETQRTGTHEIIELDVVRPRVRELLCDVIHETKMLAKHGVARRVIGVRHEPIERTGYRLHLLHDRVPEFTVVRTAVGDAPCAAGVSRQPRFQAAGTALHAIESCTIGHADCVTR
jgi:hypothetical protein